MLREGQGDEPDHVEGEGGTRGTSKTCSSPGKEASCPTSTLTKCSVLTSFLDFLPNVVREEEFIISRVAHQLDLRVEFKSFRLR